MTGHLSGGGTDEKQELAIRDSAVGQIREARDDVRSVRDQLGAQG